MQKMHDRKNVGKIILDPSMEPKPKPATPLKGKSKSIDKEDKEKKKEEDAGAASNATNGSASGRFVFERARIFVIFKRIS